MHLRTALVKRTNYREAERELGRNKAASMLRKGKNAIDLTLFTIARFGEYSVCRRRESAEAVNKLYYHSIICTGITWSAMCNDICHCTWTEDIQVGIRNTVYGFSSKVALGEPRNYLLRSWEQDGSQAESWMLWLRCHVRERFPGSRSQALGTFSWCKLLLEQGRDINLIWNGKEAKVFSGADNNQSGFIGHGNANVFELWLLYRHQNDFHLLYFLSLTEKHYAQLDMLSISEWNKNEPSLQWTRRADWMPSDAVMPIYENDSNDKSLINLAIRQIKNFDCRFVPNEV